ncbi:MAG: hypothetical protein ACO2PP_26730 [Thermocrinis sp.]|jgi:hypothetical protein|uniref:hypothetical protein n=1 Tax=Thermocrinis sp. TaxID=2024383 RepID=UPI003C0508CE
MVKEITLPSGRIARIKEGKGKDLFWALSNSTGQNDVIKLLIVRLAEIDGKPLTEDDLEELPLADVMVLIREFTELYSPLSVQKPS